MSQLSVRLGDVTVGSLERSNEGSSFRISDDYLAAADRPVLGQVFEDRPRDDHWVRQGVPPWFANLLPEGPLRELVAERAEVHPGRSFFLLAVLGADLPGAVVLEPSGDVAEPDDGSRPDDLDHELPDGVMKFSLAGVQLKFSAVRSERGLTIPTHGFGGDWIVKLPDSKYERVPENEFTMLEWARASGIGVPEAMLMPVADIQRLPTELTSTQQAALAVKRFDRGANGLRIHIEDFAQVLNMPPSQKYGSANYETVARILSSITPQDDLDELVRRLAFNVMIGNGDAHLKNWSLIYPDGRRARLAPAYDLLSTVHYLRKDRQGLNLGGTKLFGEIDRTRFLRFAERANLDVERVYDVVTRFIASADAAWHTIRDLPTTPHDLRDSIDRRLTDLPLTKR